MTEVDEIMTDADLEAALDDLNNDDGDVTELLKLMNEHRMISWEEAEQIMAGSESAPVKSSLPPQTRPSEPDNDTDIDMTIYKLKNNDSSLKLVNLNNMKRTPVPQIKRILEAMKNHEYVERLQLANMGLYDNDIAELINVVENNTSLKCINLETNYLSGEFFTKLFQAALVHETLEEIKAVNQGVSFSTVAEKEMIKAIFANHGLLKVSVNFRLPEGRHKVEQATLRNGEIRRVMRRKAAEEAKKTTTSEKDRNGDNNTKDKEKKKITASEKGKNGDSNTKNKENEEKKSVVKTKDNSAAPRILGGEIKEEEDEKQQNGRNDKPMTVYKKSINSKTAPFSK
uniref:FI20012p1 (inferred by orthology to a D. melanogaster protein) n=1 Tax=Strongyloides venezuelensis TaxID=75913 RepID=A0A0K0FKB0_STRVS